VFINYRGDDSYASAELIDRELSSQFGSAKVLLDTKSIPAGSDFVEELLGRLRTCSVLLVVVVVVIGPCWLAITDDAGRRRIDNPKDWVRREIAEALFNGIRSSSTKAKTSVYGSRWLRGTCSPWAAFICKARFLACW
jgi:hypothetical protein